MEAQKKKPTRRGLDIGLNRKDAFKGWDVG
jgi:hypothetical protein